MTPGASVVRIEICFEPWLRSIRRQVSATELNIFRCIVLSVLDDGCIVTAGIFLSSSDVFVPDTCAPK